jgi:hypothetical protein
VQRATIRSPAQPSSHALVISVSGYERQALPGVLRDRESATVLAERFKNIDYCSKEAANLGTFAGTRGISVHTTDRNLVVLAAARGDEVAWERQEARGAMTVSCVKGGVPSRGPYKVRTAPSAISAWRGTAQMRSGRRW